MSECTKGSAWGWCWAARLRYTPRVRRRRLLQTGTALGAGLALAPLAREHPSAAWALPGAARASADPGLVAGSQATVTTDGLNVRGGPGAEQPSVATLGAGASVDLLAPAADGAWWRVAADAAVGYVSARYLQPTGQPSTGDVFDLDLAFPYSRQLSPIWCDPADIEMWLDYRQGTADGPSRGLQAAIWDWETSHNAGYTVDQWDCSPFAVASAAHHWLPQTGVDHFTYDDPLAGSRVLAWLLANPGVREPSIALVWRGLHYLLVRGVRAIGDPGRDPSGARLLGFYVADPDQSASFWLGQDRFIPIERWLNELFTPVSYLTPHTGVPGDVWQGRSVAIQRSWTSAGPTDGGRRNATPASYG
jgi:hypothetical protein